MTELPSKYLSNTVNEFANLPGIGKKTALRLVLHLLKHEKKEILQFSHSIKELAENIKNCKICHSISDTEICEICSNPKRTRNTVCVVESIREVLAIENTQQYNGLYHVLGGIISPIDGIGPSDLNIDSLQQRVENENIAEIILALSTTMEGDTTNYFIHKKLADSNVKLTTLARGISFGDELEYTDEITLGRSILNRVEFH